MTGAPEAAADAPPAGPALAPQARAAAPQARALAPQALALGAYRGTSAAWDDFVRAQRGSFCHLWAWRDLMEEVTGHRPHYRGAWDAAGRLVGVNPLVEVKTRLFGHFLMSMPFLNAGGPLGSDAARAALALDARRLGQAAGVDLLELRVREPLGGPLVRSDRKITVVLELPRSEDELWRALPAKVRSQVKRPLKEGMELRVGPGEADAFYDIFAHNMRDLGTPVLPRRFFTAIRERMAGEVVFATVRHHGRAVAGACGFALGGDFEMTWASSLRGLNRLAPNMLLYWGCMKAAIERGARAFDFGRCTPGGGTHRFKRQWGGRDVPLPWAQWSASGVAATPSPERPLYRLAATLWSRLPLALANRVGPLLATRLP